MFIQTESTPNPNSLKFIPGRDILGKGTIDFASADAAAISPLARALFAHDGVERVFLAGDYVSVTKEADADWSILKTFILATLMDHLSAGLPIMGADEGAQSSEGHAAHDLTGEAAEIVSQIIALIDSRIRPAVAQDGGDVLFHSFDPESGVAYLNMRGACAGCPSSSMTLKAGIENMLRHYVPEVTRVEAAR